MLFYCETGKTVQVWFEFASTYSYLSAMRIEDAAGLKGVEIEWKPFLLGPVFKAQGWDNSPFNLYPNKGRYMVRDIERIAGSRGLKFRLPPVFPANALKAARIAVAGHAETWLPSFVRAVYHAEFADGCDITQDAVLHEALPKNGPDADAIFAKSASDEVKTGLRHNTEEAMTFGIFGAPSFRTTDGELFWGDDRLDAAITWQRSITRPVQK